jgi:hypothetical protein
MLTLNLVAIQRRIHKWKEIRIKTKAEKSKEKQSITINLFKGER